VKGNPQIRRYVIVFKTKAGGDANLVPQMEFLTKARAQACSLNVSHAVGHVHIQYLIPVNTPMYTSPVVEHDKLSQHAVQQLSRFQAGLANRLSHQAAATQTTQLSLDVQEPLPFSH
jgi:hypothetical protein